MSPLPQELPGTLKPLFLPLPSSFIALELEKAHLSRFCLQRLSRTSTDKRAPPPAQRMPPSLAPGLKKVADAFSCGRALSCKTGFSSSSPHPSPKKKSASLPPLPPSFYRQRPKDPSHPLALLLLEDLFFFPSQLSAPVRSL